MTDFFGKIFKQTILYIILVELLSFAGYFFPSVNTIAFFAIIIIVFFLSLKNLETGIFIMLAELFIGSFGKLFYFEHDGLLISIRVALWLVIMSVWLGKMITELIKTKKISIKDFFNFGYIKYFLILFVFIIFGILNGFINNNGFGNIFLDANGWFYFSLIFPMYFVFKNDFQKKMSSVLQIFSASILWLSFKTFFLLFIFSHSMMVMLDLYGWVRTSGVGEITMMSELGGFYRIFFQSHIYIVAGYFLFFLFSVKNISKYFVTLFLLLSLFNAVNIISLSRSNWVGFLGGMILVFMFILWKLGLKKFIYSIFLFILSAALGFIFVFIVVKFPYPKPTADFGMDLFSRRAQISEEAGVSSRWALLDKLWPEIKSAPVLGKGFGAVISYKSSDPRVLSQTADGNYTTFSFEWGWLDTWLKLGFFGVASYLFLIFIIIYNTFIYIKNKIVLTDIDLIIVSSVVALAVLGMINFFSPYLNHPLGIGYLLIVSFFNEKTANIK
ncbi:MAG: O-antigen ligase family protein [bacterium]